MRVAFFGSDGEFSCRSLEAIATRHAVVAIIAPPSPASWRTLRLLLHAARGRPTFSLDRYAKRLGARIRRTQSGGDTAAMADVAAAGADVICIAGFPWLLPREVVGLPPFGAVNLHGSLLPRHRGILPLFWIYYHDDRDTGVTVHRVSERADAGAILAQDSFAVPRGLPVDQLNSLNAQRGGELLTATLDALERGAAVERPQDEAFATAAPRVAPGARMVDFERWGAERVWHFLAGLYPHFQEPLVDGNGRAARYRGVRGFSISSHDKQPGHVERMGKRLELYCRDGFVELW